MPKLTTICTIILLLYACCPKPSKTAIDINRYVSTEDTLHIPFDTARVLALYDLQLRAFSENAPEDLDTFVLTDLMYACDCPSWATEEELKNTESFNSLDPKSNASHNVFYLERGDKSLPWPEQFQAMRNKVRFYGKIRTRSGWPTEEFTDPGPPAGPVFTYYGYEVLSPAYIYGPQVHVPDTTGKMPDWAQYETTVLRVTEDR